MKGNTKRAIVNAMFFIGYCAGLVGAPQLWTEKPRYFKGVVCGLVTWALLAVTIVIYRLLCAADNKKRDASARSGDATDDTGPAEVLLDESGNPVSDITDKEDRDFRYSY